MNSIWLGDTVAAYTEAMMTLADLFDQHAEACMKTAERTDDPVRRRFLLRKARDWQRDAVALRAAF